MVLHTDEHSFLKKMFKREWYLKFLCVHHVDDLR